MNFYRDCFGGDLDLMTYGDSPMKERVPEEDQNLILHSTLTSGELTIYGADGFGEHAVNFGDNITISIECDTEEEVRSIYGKLSSGGKILMQLDRPFWGGLFGQFMDKYGMGWMTVLPERMGSQ